MNSFYEQHRHTDPELPIIFHHDCALPRSSSAIFPHWHEAIEILHCNLGSVEIIIDCQRFIFSEGDMVIINSNCLHNIRAATDASAEYDCLIIGEAFCEDFGFKLSEIRYKSLISDKYFSGLFDRLVHEFSEMSPFYKTAAKSVALDILVHLSRNYIETHIPSVGTDSKKEMIKMAIKYIKKNYSKPISLDDIANDIGFSRYYFCHVFKDMTGISVINYINIVRCENAKSLILSKKHSISEIALVCGFDNFSYFSKTYKKHMGHLPSEDMK